MTRAALVLLALGACGPKKGTLPTTRIDVGGQTITVEVADEPAEHSLGLMYRKELDADAGMLFVYPGEDRRSFWMQNTSIPLSIAFMDAQGTVINIEDMVPFDRSSVPSKAPAQYALEMNKGWFAAHGVEPGDVVKNLPSAPSE